MRKSRCTRLPWNGSNGSYSRLILFILILMTVIMESPCCKPKPACTPLCIHLFPSTRSWDQSLSPAKATLRICRKEGGRNRGKEGGDQWLKFSSLSRFVESWCSSEPGSERWQSRSRAHPSPLTGHGPSSGTHTARLRRREGSNAMWGWSVHLENRRGIRHDLGK